LNLLVGISHEAVELLKDKPFRQIPPPAEKGDGRAAG